MTYVYHCDLCDEDLERDYRMGTQPEVVECPGCGAEARRVFTAPGAIIYRGTGWTGVGHGIPDMDEREKLPKPWEFDDLMEE